MRALTRNEHAESRIERERAVGEAEPRASAMMMPRAVATTATPAGARRKQRHMMRRMSSAHHTPLKQTRGANYDASFDAE